MNGRATAPEPEHGLVPPSVGESFRIALPNFEGPLDLLLHLIREHQLNVLDIPIALITEKYLEHLERMREVSLDIAGEFLVMAATLAYIKSRLLLPRQDAPVEADTDEQQKDPRAELVRRLLEYQKYKECADTLSQNDLLDRDVFTRRARMEQTPIPEGETGVLEISVYKLIEALDRVLKNAAPEIAHEVVRERISLSDAIHRIADRVRAEGTVAFYSLFESVRTRQQIVITFLAILEMCKLRLLSVRQSPEDGEIHISPQGRALTENTVAEVDDREYRS